MGTNQRSVFRLGQDLLKRIDRMLAEEERKREQEAEHTRVLEERFREMNEAFDRTWDSGCSSWRVTLKPPARSGGSIAGA